MRIGKGESMMKEFLAIQRELNDNTEKKEIEIDETHIYRAHVGSDGFYYFTDKNDYNKIALVMTPEFYKVVFEQEIDTELTQTLPLVFDLTEEDRGSTVIMAPTRIFSMYRTPDNHYCITEHADEKRIYMYLATDLWNTIFEKEPNC